MYAVDQQQIAVRFQVVQGQAPETEVKTIIKVKSKRASPLNEVEGST